MISSVGAILANFASILRSRLDLVFEHLALSHQVMVLRRSRRRAQFSGADRCFWIPLSALWDRWPKSLVIAKPATVLRWRREGVWRVWRRGKGKCRPGRPPLDDQLISLIGQMSRSNFLWGAPRLHGELLKLGLKVSQATVAKYMVPRRLGRGPGWGVFLRNELAVLRDNGLTAELKEAWDELRALWPWRQELGYGAETRLMVGPGSGRSVLGSTGPGWTSVFASMDSRGCPRSEPDNAFELIHVPGLARDSPARTSNPEDQRPPSASSAHGWIVELSDDRCATQLTARRRMKRHVTLRATLEMCQQITRLRVCREQAAFDNAIPRRGRVFW